MADPVDLLIYDAVRARLEADAGVHVIIADKVYGEPPADAVHPYVTVVSPQVVDDTNSCAVIELVVIEIHCWSREPGRIETQQMAGAVRAAMRSAPITVTGHDISQQNLTQVRFSDEPDGLTTRAIVIFEFETTPTS